MVKDERWGDGEMRRRRDGETERRGEGDWRRGKWAKGREFFCLVFCVWRFCWQFTKRFGDLLYIIITGQAFDGGGALGQR